MASKKKPASSASVKMHTIRLDLHVFDNEDLRAAAGLGGVSMTCFAKVAVAEAAAVVLKRDGKAPKLYPSPHTEGNRKHSRLRVPEEEFFQLKEAADAIGLSRDSVAEFCRRAVMHAAHQLLNERIKQPGRGRSKGKKRKE
jgi:uncharacterized protein (DUF1778 family)